MATTSNYRNLDLVSFCVMGITMRLNPENDSDFTDMQKFWDKFFKENIHEQIPKKSDTDIIAVYYDYESNYLGPYSFLIGARVHEIDKIPKGMEGIMIPPSEYAVFVSKGKDGDSVKNTWEDIWNSNITRTYTYDFEVYTEDSSDQHVDICISVKT